jgi:hypothetical protein
LSDRISPRLVPRQEAILQKSNVHSRHFFGDELDNSAYLKAAPR